MKLLDSQIREFRDNGFLILRDAFAAEQIAAVRALIEPLYHGAEAGLCSRDVDIGAVAGRPWGSAQPEIDKPTRRAPGLAQTRMYAITRELASTLLGRTAHYIFDHAIRKMAHSTTLTAWHQDQAYLGKAVELRSVNFWIPLQDVDETNGTLFYAPGSHRAGLQTHHRSGALHPHVLLASAPRGTCMPCVLKAGDLTVHHPLTLHYAGPNNSSAPRTAWGIHFGPFGRRAYLAPRTLLAVLRNRILRT